MNYYISVLELDIFPKTIYNFLFFKTNVVLKLKYCFKVEIQRSIILKTSMGKVEQVKELRFT